MQLQLIYYTVDVSLTPNPLLNQTIKPVLNVKLFRNTLWFFYVSKKTPNKLL